MVASDRTIIQKPLSDLIADQIKEEVWNKDIQFGDRLLETELAERFDVSRSTIREALKILETNELVISQARKGTYVAEFTDKDLNEILELRILIEIEAFTKAIPHLGTEQFNYLQTVIEQMKQEAMENNWKKLFDLDMTFHQYVVRLCGNSRIIKLYDSLQVQIRTCLMQLGQYYSSTQSFYQEHNNLFKTLQTKDVAKIKQQVADHIEYVEEKLLGMGGTS